MFRFRGITMYFLITVTILKVNAQIYERNLHSFIADWVTNRAMDIFYGNSSMVDVMSQGFNGLKDRTVSNVMRQGKTFSFHIPGC